MFHTSRINEILLIEDNPGDVRLIEEAIKVVNAPIRLITIRDGIEAMRYLLKEGDHAQAANPSLILLDLNIPKKSGRDILKEIKTHPYLRAIPVIILTVSQADEDIIQCYNLYANCYIVKPLEIGNLIQMMQSLFDFWFKTASLPVKKEK